MKNKKAVELNISTIIVVILALLVLVVLFLSFTGGMASLLASIANFLNPTQQFEVASAVSTCNTYLTLNTKSQFCCSTQNVKGYGEVTCSELGTNMGWDGFEDVQKAQEFCDEYECPSEETEE